jgi:hypothetical protein
VVEGEPWGKPVSTEYERKKVDAEELDFHAEAEPWSIYRLEDGTVLRVKNEIVVPGRRLVLNQLFNPRLSQDSETWYCEAESLGIMSFGLPPRKPRMDSAKIL